MDTSSDTVADSHRDALDGGGEIADYHSLSVLAIVSLMLGILSPLALLAPLMLGVALFGAAAALVALGRIAASEGTLAGRGAALLGLALCVASMAALGSRAFVTRQLVTHQADVVAREWIAALTAGHPERALGLTLETAVIRSAGAASATHDHDHAAEEGHDHDHAHAHDHAHDHDHDHDHDHEHEHAPDTPALLQFRKHPLVQRLLAAGEAARAQPAGPAQVTIETRGVQTVDRVYAVTSPAAHEPPIEVWLSAQRGRNEGEDRQHWLIIDFKPAEQVPSAPSGN